MLVADRPTLAGGEKSRAEHRVADVTAAHRQLASEIGEIKIAR
jgi:hypothetical protein